MYGFHKSRK